jgi:hypothetical protein
VHDGDRGWATQLGSKGTLEDGVTRREDQPCLVGGKFVFSTF